MQTNIRNISLHPTVRELVKKEQEAIKWMSEKNYYEKEIAEKKERIKQLRRLWRKFNDSPLVKQMIPIVVKEVQHYHADFFYHDLLAIEKYKGRFAWYVGDCGTHTIWLDNESEKEEENQRSWLNAVNGSYGSRYSLYEGNTETGVLKKVKFENLSFKIVKPLGVAQ